MLMRIENDTRSGSFIGLPFFHSTAESGASFDKILLSAVKSVSSLS